MMNQTIQNTQPRRKGRSLPAVQNGRRNRWQRVGIAIFVLAIGISASRKVLCQGSRNVNIPAEVDAASFQAESGWSFLEVYVSLPRGSVTHVQTTDGFQARFQIQVSLFMKDSLVTRDVRDNIDRVDSLAFIRSGQKLFNQSSFFIKPGKYTLKVRISDLVESRDGWHEKTLDIPSYAEDMLAISSIQLASRIEADTSRGRFVKNGFLVIPNPGGMYGLELPVLYYYMELYHLSPAATGTDSTYSVKVQIFNALGNPVVDLPVKTKIRRGSSLVEVGQTPISHLVSGSYRFHVETVDSGTSQTAVQDKGFYVYRRSDFLSSGGIEAYAERKKVPDEYSEMSSPQLDSAFEKFRFIATNQEIKMFRKLDQEGKRTFLTSFWEGRDKDPSTEINETKIDYLKRLDQADHEFSVGGKPGWKSDRGRVLLKYGVPEEIERFPSSIDKKDYQIWHYYRIEGGIVFVFVDVDNFGEMRLVHSTARNELQDEEWERWLQ